MPTFNNIGGQEPSTVSFRVGTVTVSRGSTVEHQEILCLGDPDSSNAIAAVLNAAPGSTAWALAVREVAQSTGPFAISSIAGVTTIQGNSTVVVASGNSSVIVTSGNSSVTVSAFAAGLVSSGVAAGNSSALTVRNVWSSTNADQPVSAAQAGTWNVGTVTTVTSLSSLSTGHVTVDTGSIQLSAFAAGLLSSAVLAGNSSALSVRPVWSSTGTDQPVSASQAGTWNISSLAGIVAIQGNSTVVVASGNSSVIVTSGNSSVIITSGNSSVTVSTGSVEIAGLRDSSNALVKVADSANNAVRVNVIAGGGTGGTAQGDQSAFSTGVTNMTPIGGYFSTTASAVPEAKTGILRMSSVRALWAQAVDSTGGDLTDSTQRALRIVDIAGSTQVSVSTGSVRVHQSTAADLNVTVAGYSTVVSIAAGNSSVIVTSGNSSVTVSAFAAGLVSSAVLAGNSSALSVRPVWSSTNTDQPVSAAQAGTWNVGTVTTVTSLSSLSTGHVTVDTGSIQISAFASGLLSSAVLAGNSSALSVRPVWSSTGTDQPVSASQAGTWNVGTVTTVTSLSSLSTGHVTVDTGSIRVVQSSASELLVTATIGGNLQSTAAPSSNSSGLVVRQVIDVITSFASTSALASTTVEVQSSGANLRTYVTAYTITSTNQTPAHWGFFSSNATLLWPLTLAALSSGVAGANLAVAPPGYLFRTAASDALNFKTAGSTVAGVQLGVSYFRAP